MKDDKIVFVCPDCKVKLFLNFRPSAVWNGNAKEEVHVIIHCSYCLCRIEGYLRGELIEGEKAIRYSFEYGDSSIEGRAKATPIVVPRKRAN